VCLSAEKVTFNTRQRTFDPLDVGQFGPLHYHSNFKHFGFLCRNNRTSLKFPVEKRTFAYRSRLQFCVGFAHVTPSGLLQVTWKTKPLLVIQRSDAKIPPFSNSLLIFTQFDGTFIGNCKGLLILLKLLRFITCSGWVLTEDKMSHIGINPKTELRHLQSKISS